MKKETSEKQNLKKPYDKPVLGKIDLLADEMMSVGCKTSYGGGPLGPCVISGCHSTVGS